MTKGKKLCHSILAATVLGLSTTALAHEGEHSSAGSKVSGAAGIDYASHFISYGADVWGGGDDFYGSESTTFYYMEFTTELPDGFSITAGAWSDVNDNVDDSLGGNIQEIDVYLGVGYSAGIASYGVTYQQWYYGGSTAERILDLSVGLDDSGWWGGDFALNPSALIHMRVGSGTDIDAEEGEVIVLGVGPSFPVGKATLDVPISVAYSTTDDYFGAGGDSGYAYTSIGLSLGLPLAFIGEEYGSWGIAFSPTYYMTDEDVYPGNPEENFLVGIFSLGVSY